MKIMNLLQSVEMADLMRSEGKIYVVVAGLVIIMLGVLGFLFYLDRKISKVEKEVDSLKK